MGGEQEHGELEHRQTVAEAVRDRARVTGLTQQQLAAEAGVSLATIQELMRGVPRRRQPRTLAAISEALGWAPGHISALLAGEDPAAVQGAEQRQSPAYEAVMSKMNAIEEDLHRVQDRLDAVERAVVGKATDTPSASDSSR